MGRSDTDSSAEQAMLNKAIKIDDIVKRNMIVPVD
jgi:hypothetical protein